MDDTDDAALAAEARVFSRYLVGRVAPPEVIDRYVAANRALLTRPPEARDAALVAFVRRRPWSVSLLDAATGLFRPGGLLRSKILVMSAILEASPAFADEFLPRPVRPAVLVLSVAALGLTAAVRAALGTLVYAVAVRGRA